MGYNFEIKIRTQWENEINTTHTIRNFSLAKKHPAFTYLQTLHDDVRNELVRRAEILRESVQDVAREVHIEERHRGFNDVRERCFVHLDRTPAGNGEEVERLPQHGHNRDR